MNSCEGVLKSNGYGDFVILEDRNSREVLIRFVMTGTERICRRDSVMRGAVADPYFPKIAGVGFTGDGLYSHSKYDSCGKIPSVRASSAWASMLKRCYYEGDKNYLVYGGSGVFVNESWHNFQNFAEWYNKQQDDKTYQIDKDLLFVGNKEYSETNCIFIPKDVNLFFKATRSSENKLLPGVMLPKLTDRKNHRSKPYVGVWEGSKLFNTEIDCHFAYINYKRERLNFLITKYGSEVIDKRFLPAMLDRLSILDYLLTNRLAFIGWEHAEAIYRQFVGRCC